jgi:hypothetical protein
MALHILDFIVWWSSKRLLANLNWRVIIAIDFLWLFFHNTSFRFMRNLFDRYLVIWAVDRMGHFLDGR